MKSWKGAGFSIWKTHTGAAASLEHFRGGVNNPPAYPPLGNGHASVVLKPHSNLSVTSLRHTHTHTHTTFKHDSSRIVQAVINCLWSKHPAKNNNTIQIKNNCGKSSVISRLQNCKNLEGIQSQRYDKMFSLHCGLNDSERLTEPFKHTHTLYQRDAARYCTAVLSDH